MPQNFIFDVFLSHSSKDKIAVRDIAKRLKEDGLKVWFDEWQIKPGDSIPAKFEEGLENSRVLILCMSANAFGSDWAQLESYLFRFRDPLNKGRRFIPLRLDDTPIKGSLSQFHFISWQAEERDIEYGRLVEACKLVAKTNSEIQQAVRSQMAMQSTALKRNSGVGIQESTVKRLFGMSANRCAIPDCKCPLVISDTVVGEICHIRNRKKSEPRYDYSLRLGEKDQFENLILLCGTCHHLINANPDEYDAGWLQSVKRNHEAEAPQPIDLSMSEAQQAMLILAKYLAQVKKEKKTSPDNLLGGKAHVSATHGGVSIAITGQNNAPINIKTSASKSSGSSYPANSIGADANMTNYVEYLCDLYVKFMRPIEPDEGKSWAKIGNHIKAKFHLKKRTRNHLSAERFWDLVHFLINQKLALTPVGRKHLRQGTKLCRTFDEFRHGEM